MSCFPVFLYFKLDSLVFNYLSIKRKQTLVKKIIYGQEHVSNSLDSIKWPSCSLAQSDF